MLIKNLSFDEIRDLPKLGYIYFLIKDLDNYYPNFHDWYFNRFIQSVLLGNDIALVLKNRYEEIIGVSLLKKQEKEVKLRALRISNKYKNKGYGLYLLDKSLKILDEPLPFCTVSEELINSYSRIFINRYGFSLDYIERNCYRKNKNEYFFNVKNSNRE